MQYPYTCKVCSYSCVIEKSIKLATRQESCKCGQTMSRAYTAPYIVGAKVQDAFYSHALGKVVSNRKAESKEASNRGLTEVGNENLNKHIKPKETTYPTVDELHKAGAFN